jgi:hypothetical protein
LCFPMLASGFADLVESHDDAIEASASASA